MKDFLGNEIIVGDEVVYISKGGSGSVNLEVGRIYKIEKGIAYIEELDKSWRWKKGVKSVSIVKINSNERL